MAAWRDMGRPATRGWHPPPTPSDMRTSCRLVADRPPQPTLTSHRLTPLPHNTHAHKHARAPPTMTALPRSGSARCRAQTRSRSRRWSADEMMPSTCRARRSAAQTMPVCWAQRACQSCSACQRMQPRSFPGQPVTQAALGREARCARERCWHACMPRPPHLAGRGLGLCQHAAVLQQRRGPNRWAPSRRRCSHAALLIRWRQRGGAGRGWPVQGAARGGGLWGQASHPRLAAAQRHRQRHARGVLLPRDQLDGILHVAHCGRTGGAVTAERACGHRGGCQQGMRARADEGTRNSWPAMAPGTKERAPPVVLFSRLPRLSDMSVICSGHGQAGTPQRRQHSAARQAAAPAAARAPAGSAAC